MWEHTVIMIGNYDDPLAKIQKELKKASSNGWELVSVTNDIFGCDTSNFYLFFKRPAQQQ